MCVCLCVIVWEGGVLVGNWASLEKKPAASRERTRDRDRERDRQTDRERARERDVDRHMIVRN